MERGGESAAGPAALPSTLPLRASLARCDQWAKPNKERRRRASIPDPSRGRQRRGAAVPPPPGPREARPPFPAQGRAAAGPGRAGHSPGAGRARAASRTGPWIPHRRPSCGRRGRGSPGPRPPCCACRECARAAAGRGSRRGAPPASSPARSPARCLPGWLRLLLPPPGRSPKRRLPCNNRAPARPASLLLPARPAANKAAAKASWGGGEVRKGRRAPPEGHKGLPRPPESPPPGPAPSEDQELPGRGSWQKGGEEEEKEGAPV